MLKAGEITGDLKNLNKTTFERFEKFVKEKIEARIRIEEIEQKLEGIEY